jgi:hypothetical protein
MYSGDEGRDTLSRNHINALTADLVVVLPGGSGTLSELELVRPFTAIASASKQTDKKVCKGKSLKFLDRVGPPGPTTQSFLA